MEGFKVSLQNSYHWPIDKKKKKILSRHAVYLADTHKLTPQ